MTGSDQMQEGADRWKGLYKAGSLAGWGMLAIMAVQIIIFVAWPPPQTVEGFFALFRESWLLGLLSMDLLYILNNAILAVIYLALYAALKREAESATLIALVLGLVGIAAYFASNTGFEMLSLSSQYWMATADPQRLIALAAGEAVLAIYRGTAFNVYYVLNAATLLILAVVMLRSAFFDRTTAYWGLASGILMTIPSTAGAIGLVFSLLSLAPWAVFLVRVTLRFSAHARGMKQEDEHLRHHVKE